MIPHHQELSQRRLPIASQAPVVAHVARLPTLCEPVRPVDPSLSQESWVSRFFSQIRSGSAYTVTPAYHVRSVLPHLPRLPTCTLTSHMVDHYRSSGSGHHTVASHTRWP